MRCQPVGGGVCYKSCDAFMQPEFFLVGNRARNGVANVIAFKNLFSSILSRRICDRSAQFLVNCLEKIFMATNKSGFNSSYMFACK